MRDPVMTLPTRVVLATCPLCGYDGESTVVGTEIVDRLPECTGVLARREVKCERCRRTFYSQMH